MANWIGGAAPEAAIKRAKAVVGSEKALVAGLRWLAKNQNRTAGPGSALESRILLISHRSPPAFSANGEVRRTGSARTGQTRQSVKVVHGVGAGVSRGAMGILRANCKQFLAEERLSQTDSESKRFDAHVNAIFSLNSRLPSPTPSISTKP